MNTAKNNRIALVLTGLTFLLLALFSEWMVFGKSPSDHPAIMYNPTTVTGFNGSITLGFKLPIWLAVTVGTIGQLLQLSNTLRITSLSRGITWPPVLYLLVVVITLIWTGISHDEVHLRLGPWLALSGLIIGLIATFRPLPASRSFLV
ncbi:MAG: hypothetical protein J6386_05605 [Candidatus Synoicihabitans palmerolidicus]|nr:hypothetical protein [Candidatus Synoicihabitans palmerolidicus]